MKCNLTEWLKGEDVFRDHDKVVELMCIEQFLIGLNDEACLWLLEQPGKKNLERAAELAEEFSVRRSEKKERGKAARKSCQETFKHPEPNKHAGQVHKESANNARLGKEKGEQEKNRARAFGAKKLVACFRCHETRHLAIACRNFFLVGRQR